MYPAEFGFKMPPEWEKHSRTFMEWPVKEAIWPEPFTEILPVFADIAQKIASFEPVTLIARPELADQATHFCGPGIDILPLEHNDSWMRDNGPTFLTHSNGEIAGINWIFTGWGGKFPANDDNRVASRLLRHLEISCFDLPIVMEGGSFHVDGEGTLLTTEECLLNPNRNPQLHRNQIENLLKQSLNVSKVIWLKKGWVGDDTDGHVDNLACFARPGLIITQVCSDPADPNYEISRENIKILETATDAGGRHFKIIPIEQPPADYYQDNRLTLSYLNFYFVNGGIILPQFGSKAGPNDQRAKDILQQLFPERKIMTINGLIIARGGGNVHCLTQQMPAGI
ncbi:MAG TPA: agmatine deiminase [Firmicutes bacterium]|jgi:agmatine deiminase|nr:agmatine deiminase [Bacillota bacterium]